MKKARTNLHAAIAIVLSLIVVLEIGYITLMNPFRVDLSARKFYTLSARSLSILDELDRDVRITICFEEKHPLFHDVQNLLEEYQAHSPRHISTVWIDPKGDRAATEELGLKYDLVDHEGKIEIPVVVFDMDDGARTRAVSLLDLVEMERVQGRKEPVMKAFKGEQAFSSALYELIHGENPKVYFLAGHGEHSIADTTRHTGLSQLRKLAARENLDVAELVLQSKSRLPEDADAVVIPGPKQEMAAHELEMIEEYLEKGGRLLVLLDADVETGLEPMLRRWGIWLRNDIVFDPENTRRGADVVIRTPYFNPNHPITQPLGAAGLDVAFYLPRSISPLTRGENTAAARMADQVDWLFVTSEKSYTKTDISGSTVNLQPDTRDIRGPQVLGATVERGGKTGLDVQIAPSKMVVVGDCDFVCNGLLSGGNSELFMGSLNWLLEREIAVSPKPIERIEGLNLTRRQIYNLFWINVVGIPCVAIVLGLFIWYRRRK